MRKPFDGRWRLTQGFGENPEVYAKYGMKGHNGDDYGLIPYTPVYAVEDGRVSVLEDRDKDGNLTGFGNYIQLVGTYKWVYAHLARAMVSNGVMVREGDFLGYSGNTGDSSGPHLHFGVKSLKPDYNNGYFGAIDPLPILNGNDNQGELTMTPEVKAAFEDIKVHVTTVEKQIEALQKAVYGGDFKVAETPLTARVEDVKQQVIDRAKDLAVKIK